MASTAELTIEGRKVPVSNLGKVLYPKTGFTKGDVIDYYVNISPVLLPHLKGRALTLKRYPNGVDGMFFYEKSCPKHRPPWVSTQDVWSEGRNDNIPYCTVEDLPTLVWLANLADLELHTFMALAKAPLRPTTMVFDLDPGAPATIAECCVVALRLRAALRDVGLESFPKTSGSKGLQLYVPLNTPATFDATKGFAHRLAEAQEKDDPKLVVSKMQKNLRDGKVLIDWSQNDDHKTTVCVYSLRAKEQPAVSTPLAWDEVESCAKSKKPGELVFDTKAALRRAESHGDLFAPVLKLKQRLPKSAASGSALV